MSKRKIFLAILILSFLGIFLWQISLKPSNDRNWTADQEILPWVQIENDNITIHNVRDFSYRQTTDYDINYQTKNYRLDDLVSLDYLVAPFSGIGAAHTFLSFGFEDGDYLAVSVEIRKKEGDKFSPLRGLFRQYELMYVLGTEEDIIKLRTNHRQEDVYLYPTKTTPEQIQVLFLDVLRRINQLAIEPEFYNTITNNCTTNLALHINNVWPQTIPRFDPRLVFPKNSDILIYNLGLLDISTNPKDSRDNYYINDKAQRHEPGENFSALIRE